MDPRLLHHYNQELQHLREMGAEFAEAFPKIASRLGIDGIEVSDPYVERLIEGFAFLAGRVQLRLDAEFPRFTQRLLDVVYPQILAPTPAMLIAQLQPDLTSPNLVSGLVIARGSEMRSGGTRASATPCQFRSAHDITLWPIELTQVEYFTHAADLPLAALPQLRRYKSGVRLRLRTTGGLDFAQLPLESLRLHCSGIDEVAYRLFELIAGHTLGALLMPARRPAGWSETLPATCIEPVGWDDDQALLPVGLKGFHGYRLMQEFFAFPQRFLFFDIAGLGPALRRHGGSEVDIVLLFERADASLDQNVDAGSLALNCVPAINLFERRCDRIHVSPGTHDFQVIVDRTRPADFEVYELTELVGHGVGVESERTFLPLYAAFHTEDRSHSAFYTAQREPRLLSAALQRQGPRSSYVGSEVYLSIVDQREAPFSGDLRQLASKALCTNRDLPMLMPIGTGSTDLTLEQSAAVQAIRVIKGPSRPISSLREGKLAWRFINQLTLDHLSLVDTNATEGAAALRELLTLYAPAGDAGAQRQIEGVRSVAMQASVRRLPMRGPITFGRGVRIDVEVDDFAFQGGSAFLLGCVLERFFARHVSLNGFTETRLHSAGRGEIKHWGPRCGAKTIL
jgi:type VI secretion system protein ImpG